LSNTTSSNVRSGVASACGGIMIDAPVSGPLATLIEPPSGPMVSDATAAGGEPLLSPPHALQ